MRIAAVIPCLPEPPDRGAFKRYAALIDACARAGEVHCACLTDETPRPGAEARFAARVARLSVIPVQLQPWKSLLGQLADPFPPNVRHWHDPQAVDGLRRFLIGHQYDVAMLGDLVMVPYAEAAGLQDVPLWIDRSRVDVVFQRLVAENNRLGFAARIKERIRRSKTAAYERQVAGRIAGQVVCAPSDKTGLLACTGAGPRIEVIANGIERHLFPDQGPLTNAPIAMFPAAMDYQPNVDGITWFVREAWSAVRAAEPNAELYLVGRNPAPAVQDLHGRDGITVTGAVDSMLPWYAKARCVVTPIRIGGGTRLKIVEAWSVGRPLVSTTVGADGLDARHQQNCLIADDGPATAQAVLAVFRDQALAERLRAGALVSGAAYAWENVMAPLPGFLHSTAKRA